MIASSRRLWPVVEPDPNPIESEPPHSARVPTSDEWESSADGSAESPMQRLVRLQELTNALGNAITTDEVVYIVSSMGLPAGGADVALFFRLSMDGTELVCVYESGGLPCKHGIHHSVYAPLPIGVAVRTREAIWCESEAEIVARFPAARPYLAGSSAVAAVPLVIGGRAVGAFAFSYASPERFAADRRAFLSTVASQCAQALERARLFDEEQRARTTVESERSVFDAVVQAAPVAITLLDREGAVHLWNPAAERMTGYRREEVLGQPFPVVSKEQREELLYRLAGGMPLAGHEAVHVRRSGEPYNAVMWTTPVRAPNGQQLSLVTIADATERKRANEALIRLSEATRALGGTLDYAESMRMLVSLAVPWLADFAIVHEVQHDGTIRRVAFQHRDPAGYEQLAKIETPTRYPEGHPLADALRRQESVLIGEGDGLPEPELTTSVDERHATRRLGVRSSLSVPLVARGRPLGVLILAYSDSGRTHGEHDRRLAEELARRAAVALDNARLYREAQDAIELRDDFVSIASHELKTPLTALVLQAQGIARTIGQELPADDPLLARFTTMDRQIERLTQLVNSLLDMSRLSRDGVELDLEPVDLAALARGVADRFGSELARAGCALTVNADAEVVGTWDRARLERVVTSLLSNASKYGSEQPIELSVVGEGDRARLTVRDHGIGISVENQARIFGRFERAVSSRHYGGFGLGLWIARQTVGALGGSIRVESTPGAGAVFTVELPR